MKTEKSLKKLGKGLRCLSAILLILSMTWACQDNSETGNLPGQWPVLKHYDKDHVDRIALPLGGIGTGTV